MPRCLVSTRLLAALVVIGGACAQSKRWAPKLPPVDLQRGLLLHYACDHERPVALDTSGHNHHGELDGARFERVDGRLALRFTGGKAAGDVVRVRHSKALSRPESTGAVSIALWLKVNSELPQFPVLVCKGGNHRPTWGGYELHLNSHPDNDLQVTSGPFTAATHNAFGRWIDKRAGRWIHVCFTLERTGRTIFYVDGRSTDDVHTYRTDIKAALAAETRDLFVGGPDPKHHENRSWFDGWLDELRIYDRALLPDEVRALRDRGR